MASKYFALVCLLAATAIGVSADEPEKIVKGVRARNGEFPYMAAIFKNGYFHCGGAIVRSDLILTAAHCVDPLMNDATASVLIMTGSNNLRSVGDLHNPAAYYRHSKWSPANSWSYDVGFIKLATPININAKQQVIPISKVPPPPAGTKVMISAWGSTGYPNGDIPDFMEKLQLSIMDNRRCRAQHKFPISEIQICTYNGPGEGTCQGDSGSPLVHNGKLIGVVSGGIPCATGVADIFTNLYYTQDFINYVFQHA